MTTAPPPLLLQAVRIARAAGEAIMQVYATAFAVQTKDDHSPLTEADLAAHRLIEHELAALTPDIPRLSEESAPEAVAARRDWPRLWLIDPLDGTREFVSRNGEFTVNIALVEHGRATLGVVHVPAQDTCYAAALGQGAWKIQAGGQPTPIRCRPWPQHEVCVAGSRRHGVERLEALLARLGPHQLISAGSALKFCLVAEGAADLYPRFGPTSEWDTAAGQCLIEATGGAVLALDGQPLRYNARDTLLNPEFFAASDAAQAARLLPPASIPAAAP
jgi:3'(2'), 5'-bisphosphate nucleotidase